MNHDMLNELLGLTHQAADAVNLKLIALNQEISDLSPEVAEAADAAYSFLAAAKEQGLSDADLAEISWAKDATKVFEARRESLETRVRWLTALNHAKVRYNLTRAVDPGRPLVGEADPEFERLLAEGDPEYDALNIDQDSFADFRAMGAQVPQPLAGPPDLEFERMLVEEETEALLKAIKNWDGYDRETGQTDSCALDVLRGIAARLEAGTAVLRIDY